jgi:hypothetical protein
MILAMCVSCKGDGQCTSTSTPGCTALFATPSANTAAAATTPTTATVTTNITITINI